jgi:hypothetical protein
MEPTGGAIAAGRVLELATLAKERAEALYQSGRTAADAFFSTWDFTQYKRKYRQAARKTGETCAGGSVKAR